MKALFWLSLVFILYAYAGYPLVLWVWARVRPRPVAKAAPAAEPLVTVVVAARNEEQNIGKRIENLLAQSYPPRKLEIIVVSDGSTDGTDRIVEERAARETASIERGSAPLPRLRLVRVTESRGKPNALNTGVGLAHGEIVVFTDARQEFDANTVRELVGNFADPSVGSVSGELVFRECSEAVVRAEIGLYWTIEKWIRKTEGLVHSIAGATGAIYAIRRELFETIPEETILDDVYVPMKIVCRGYRNVFDERSIARDVFSMSIPEERRRKVRTLLGNYQLLRLMPELSSPAGNPIFFQFFSHKIARLFVPFFFIALFVSSAVVPGPLYRLALWGIVALLLLAVFRGRLSRVPLLGKLGAVSSTFFMLNYFALLAFLSFIRPGKAKVW
jgi:cellulose synthase/poly-beta-1,6-N-acetylglucosamine synthase-like glycosyltransferase